MSGIKFHDGICARCKCPTIIRPDGLPFCSKCEKEMTERFEKIRPDLAGKKKLRLFHTPVKPV